MDLKVLNDALIDALAQGAVRAVPGDSADSLALRAMQVGAIIALNANKPVPPGEDIPDASAPLPASHKEEADQEFNNPINS